MRSLIRTTCALLVAGTGILSASAAPWWDPNPLQPALPESVVSTNADSSWTLSPAAFLRAEDKTLGKPVLTVGAEKLTLESKARLAGNQELRALVRLPTVDYPAVIATFSLDRKDAQNPGVTLQVTAARGHDRIAASVIRNGQALHDLKSLSDKLAWVCPFTSDFTYTLRSYTQILPGWPEDYRAWIEHDMAALPDHNAKWLEARIELRKGSVRCWLDDHLVAVKNDPGIEPDGLARIELGPGAQLAGCAFGQVKELPRGFLPIRLGGYANAKKFAKQAAIQADALPPAGAVVQVAGIPFVNAGVNPEGNDHIDVGQSLFREANSQDYLSALSQWWAGSALRDPARIQLRIPNGQYDSLYLIAASDEDSNEIPLITAMFFRPYAGFPENFEARVPLATARSAEARPLPVVLANGRKANLWLVKIPLDPGRLSAFADLDIVEVELTKKVYQYRYYPDPAVYGWHQGGPPSAVHIYAATLGETPVGFDLQPDKFGHVWVAPEIPGYTATCVNRTAAPQAGKLTVVSTSYDGAEQIVQQALVSLAPGQTGSFPFRVEVKLNGYHRLDVSLTIADQTWTERRSFVRLAPDTRTLRWTEGKGPLFGFWDYGTSHHGPTAARGAELLTKAGARTATTYSLAPATGLATNEWVERYWGRVAGSYCGSAQDWAKQEPFDPVQYHTYQTNNVMEIQNFYAGIPQEHRPDFVSFFGESVISLRMTSGNYPEYWHGAPYVPTAEEDESIRKFSGTARCLGEGFRAYAPGMKILIEWGDPLFNIPLLRAGFPTNLIDGAGLDNAGFERLPEQQLHQVSLHRLYELKSEFAKRGIANPALYYLEGPFFPTEIGSLSWREQMDIQDRFALISMAYGVSRFYSGWFTFDCADWVGAEHYGGCGIFRRVPYCDPKPAYAAYATMTEKLNEANFDGWLKTGSLNTYCLRFKGPRGNVYTLWTLRGRRPVILTLAADAKVEITDPMNNSLILDSRNRQVTFRADSSVRYVTGAGEITAVAVGEPDHADAQPGAKAVEVADLGNGKWAYTSHRDLTYENNDFDTFRYPGRFSCTVTKDPQMGKVLLSRLERQDTAHELMPWYNTLVPKTPVVLKGAPSYLGLWVRGAGDWGRVVYCLRDAKGERWISVGSKDQWNCDDLHSWSSFNFDGWRYLRFEMPGHVGFDNFRRHGTSWWGSYGGDEVVDLPLTLEKIIVEQRTHILYVNDVQPVATNTVAFGKLYAEYAAPEDAKPEAVSLSRIRRPLPTGMPDLPNPIREMAQQGSNAPTAILRLEAPAWAADGTRMHVHFQEMPGAKNYYLWVSAHEDGRGAVNMTPAGAKNEMLLEGLRPGVRLYFWIVWQDEKGTMSKPSPVHAETLANVFKEQ